MKTKYPLGLPAACRRWLSALPLLLVLAATSHAALVFDNATNAQNGTNGGGVFSTSSTPNTFMGDGYNLLSGAFDITGFDLYPVNNSGTDYTGLKITIYVWGAVNTTGTVNATTPAFSNLLNTYTLTTAGTFTNGFYFPFESATPGVTPGITLGAPLTIPSSTVGLTFAYQGTTDGVNFASANGLSSTIAGGPAPTVGSDVFNGYYRNANSETNGNFTSSLRSLGGIGAQQSVMVRVYGDAVPEPSTLALVPGGVGLLLFLRRKGLRKSRV